MRARIVILGFLPCREAGDAEVIFGTGGVGTRDANLNTIVSLFNAPA